MLFPHPWCAEYGGDGGMDIRLSFFRDIQCHLDFKLQCVLYLVIFTPCLFL